MQKPKNPIETLKRLQQQQAAKAESQGRPRLSVVKRRMIQSSVKIRATLPDDILFQHTVFCQTVLPYRDPGPNALTWERDQGNVKLFIKAGEAYDPTTRRLEKTGLPFGTAARLILCHLNTEALRTGSPVIEVKGSMTAFVRRLQRYQPNGAQIRKFKDQLTRLSTSTIRLVAVQETRAVQINTQIVAAFDVWEESSEGDRFIFPEAIKLSAEYFTSLQEHAVPLDERAVAALAHSAMALDIYMWLAQRLHRVDPRRGQFIPWVALYQQFGQGYDRIRDFRRAFLGVLQIIKTQYSAARFGIDKGGMMLGNSPPPVPQRYAIPLPPQRPPTGQHV